MGRLTGVPAAAPRGGRARAFVVRFTPLLPLLSLGSLALVAGGCQGAQPIKTVRLIEHQALIDFSGLKPVEHMPELKVNAAPPRSWEALPPNRTAMYTHYQWRSPSARTGVGAAHVRLPLPLNAKAVLWFAKQQYAKKQGDGRQLGQWVDALGRHWFEAENEKYHVRGYCLAQGFEAWIVYWGYRRTQPPEPTEISLAARCSDTFVPLTGVATPSKPPPATAPSTLPVKASPATRPVAGAAR